MPDPRFKTRAEYDAWKAGQGGTATATNLVPCPDCHKDISPRAPTCPHCGAPQGAPVDAAVTRDFSGFNAHYQREFQKIRDSREQYKGRWNWAAFFGGVFWAYYQGVWLAATLALLIVLMSLTGGVQGLVLQLVALVYLFAFGYRGTYLLYSAVIKKRQLPI